MTGGKRRWLFRFGVALLCLALAVGGLIGRLWWQRAEHQRLREAEASRAPVAAPKRAKTKVPVTPAAAAPSLCLRGQVLDRGEPVAGMSVSLPNATLSVTGPCACRGCRCPEGLAALLANPRAGLLLAEKSAPTAADGTFAVCGLTLPLPPFVWAEHADGRLARPQREVLLLQAGGATALEVVAPLAFTGVVRTASGPLPNARVLAYSTPALQVRDVQTDEAGRFSTSLPAGSATFVIAAPGREPTALVRGVEFGAPVVLTVEDPFALVVRAVLNDAPVPNAEVHLNGELAGATDEKGELRRGGLTPRESVRVRVTAGAAVGTASVIARAGGQQRLDVRLRPGVRVRGVVIDEKGQPRIGRVTGLGPPPPVETDAQGRFESELLEPGASVTPRPLVEGCEAERSTALQLAAADATVMLKVRCEVTAEGTVLDADGAPVANALVSLQSGGASETAATDAAGRFTLHQPAGTYALVVSHPRYRQSERPLTLPAKAVTVVLDAGGTISGRVVDGAGKPVPGARVKAVPGVLDDLLRELEGGGAASSTTDLDGAFEVTGLLAGRWVLVVNGASLPSTPSEPVVLQPGAHHAGLVITVDAKVDLSGVIRDQKRQPVAGASVRWDPADEKAALKAVLLDAVQGRMDQALRFFPSEVFSDADGRFEVRGLPLSKVKLDISAPGFAELEQLASRGDRLEVTLERQGGVVKGRVVDEAGRPVRRFRVDGSDFTADDGRFEVAAYGASDSVRVAAEGYVPTTKVVKVDQAVVELGDVVLAKGLALRVVVVSDDGKPLEGAKVAAAQPGEGGGTCSTDAEGRCSLQPFLDEETVVKARRDGFVPVEAKVARGRFGEALQLTLKPAGGRLQGQVFGAPGRPAGARSVFVSSDTVNEFVLTDERGQFSKAGVPDGAYCVSVELSGLIGTEWAVTAQATANPGPVVLGPVVGGATLETRSLLPGRVVLLQGAQPPLARAALGGDSAASFCRARHTNVITLIATGATRVEGLPPGKWSVFVLPISDADDEGAVEPTVIDALPNQTTRVP